MRKLILLSTLAVVITVCQGCANTPTPAQGLFATATAYQGAELGITAYEANPAANPATIATLKHLDTQAYNAIFPVANAAATGGSPVTTAEVEAAQAALAAITAYKTQNGVK